MGSGEYKRSYSFITGAIVGAVVFFLIYGFSVILPTNVSWLHHSIDLEGLADLTQHELGWEMFRRSPWLFPIGLFTGLSPEPLSVVYTDSIPLFAIVFKLLSPILPDDFQYMGLFEFITYILMGGFGALIAARFSHGKKEAGLRAKIMDYAPEVCAALIMTTAPVLTKRVFYHTALSAHFLILGAILIVIYRQELGDKKRWLYLFLLVFFATNINAYYIPMILGIYGCSVLYGFMIRSGRDWKVDLLALFASGASSLIYGAFLGMFSGDVSSSAENMESVSYNLNGLINPGNDILVHLKDMPLYDYQNHESYSIILKGFSVFSPWQSEGFSYLGLGVLLLLVFVAVAACIETKDGSFDINVKLAVSIAVTGLVFLALAMGPVGTVGTHEIYHLNWSEKIYRILSVFRTAGRFIWVIYFGAISLIIMYASWSKKRFMKVLLILCTIIQIVDISPSLAAKHETYASVGRDYNYENELMQSEVFKYLGQQCDEIIFVNPTTAIRMRPYWSTVFEEYALINDMDMNAAYCSRDTTPSADKYSDRNIKMRQAGERFPNILYVFINEDIMKEQAHKFDLNVYAFDNIYIGTDLDLSGFDEVTEVR